MFKTRLISGIVLVILALATIICSGPVLLVTLIGVSCIGMQELYRAAGVHEGKTNGLEIAGYLAVVIYYLTIAYLPVSYHLPAVILGVLVMMCIFVFTYPKYQNKQIMTAFFGMVYVGVMLSYIYQTRVLPGGAFLVWLIFLCSWGCDTCAYCVGVLIGKHKMAPKLSPKKSIEGGIGGLAGAALLGALYALAINKWGGASAGVVEYALICFVGGIISMIGDLAASAIKRNHEIKDYGKLIPGHGGILDRFDSVIFTAPVIYYLAVALM